jgi:uncharacterized protein (DUF2384 family)
MSVKYDKGTGLMDDPKQLRRPTAAMQNKRAGGKLAKSVGIKRVGTAKVGKLRAKKSAAKRKDTFSLHKQAEVTSGVMLAGGFFNKEGLVIIDAVAQSFGMSKGQLAETVGVKPETFQRFSRAFAPKTQSRLKEMIEIVGRVANWAGGKNQAMAWYRAEPIAAFGGRTAESLVKAGKAGAVRDYLDHVALGGFA